MKRPVTADCPRCQGQGLIFDPDPQKPVLVCGCTADVAPDAETLGLPARYREADFARFWKWWNNVQACHARALLDRVADLEDLLARPVDEVGELEGREDLAKLLAALKRRPEHGIRPAGAEALFQWASNGKHKFRHGWELWWIHGPAQSGRSTLAAAALRAWTERTGRGGRFVSVRTLSQAIKDAYYDSRSFQNQAFQSVRDLVEPLQDPPLLVLDDWDRMDTDIRVAAAAGPAAGPPLQRGTAHHPDLPLGPPRPWTAGKTIPSPAWRTAASWSGCAAPSAWRWCRP